MNLEGDFVDKTLHNVDSEILDILIKEYEKFKRKKTVMFMNKGGTIIKNFETSTHMKTIIDIASKLNGVKEGRKKEFTLLELEVITIRFSVLTKSLLKCKDFNMDYAKDLEEMKDKFDSMFVAAAILN